MDIYVVENILYKLILFYLYHLEYLKNLYLDLLF